MKEIALPSQPPIESEVSGTKNLQALHISLFNFVRKVVEEKGCRKDVSFRSFRGSFYNTTSGGGQIRVEEAQSFFFGTKWNRMLFESNDQSTFKRRKMYSEYIGVCNKLCGKKIAVWILVKNTKSMEIFGEKYDFKTVLGFHIDLVISIIEIKWHVGWSVDGCDGIILYVIVSVDLE